MLRNRKLWLLPLVALAAVLLNAGYLTRAKKGAPPAAPVTPPPAAAPAQGKILHVPEPGIMLSGKPTEVPGVRGNAVKSAVLNFAELPQADGETNGNQEEREREVEAPQRDSDSPTLPDGWQHPLAALSENSKTASRVTDTRKHILAGVPAPAPLSSFLAVDEANTGTLVIPPDSHGAVGPNHVITATNLRMRIHTKAGSTVSTVNLDGVGGFWGPLSIPAGEAFDPRVIYDPYAQRWVLVCVAFADAGNSSILIAATASADPTGQWFQFQVDVDNSNTRWADFPTLGFNANWATVQVNMFPLSAGGAPTTRSQVFTFNKTRLYANGVDPFTFFPLDELNPPSVQFGSTQIPAVTYDPAQTTQYLVNRFSSAGGALKIFTITGTADNPMFTDTGLTPVSPINWSILPRGDNDEFAPQAGGPGRILNNDSRMGSVVFRNGSLWCAHTVFYPAGGSPTRSAVQWWQLSPTGATVQQRGVIDDPTGNTFYAFPSLAVNANNDVLVGYSRFSGTQFASANYAFRASGDPANTLREDAIMKAGEGFYYQVFDASGNRWGDYSATVVDPSNDLDMWTIQEYAIPPANTSIPGRWGTWWVRVRSDGSPAPPAAPPQPAPTPNPNPPAPSNDPFAGAQTLTGCTALVVGQNINATKETGEPSHVPDNNPGGKSIWYRWTAPATGTVTINTDGSPFDTTLGVYTGNSVSGLNVVIKDDDSGLGLNSMVSFTATNGTVYQIAVDGYNNSGVVGNGDVFLNLSMQAGGCAPATTVQFTRPAYSTLESTGVAVLTLQRQGSVGGAMTVDYQTSDGGAVQRTDYTVSSGTVSFAANEIFKTLAIPITDDSYVESTENLTVTLSNPVGGSLNPNNAVALNIVDNDQAGSPTNPINTSRFFVRQQYADFLSREPDQGGFDFWTGELTSQVEPGLFTRRHEVSTAFFAELEFQKTGAYVYRAYRAAFGNTQPFPNPMGDMDGHPFCQANPNNCSAIRAAHMPAYNNFVSDRARVVGSANLAAAQQAYANAFVLRNEFTTRYPASLGTAEQFVDAVLATLSSINVNLSSQRAALIAEYNAAGGGNNGRGRVIYRLADDNVASPIDNRVFINAEFNRAFVATQYFGYLRRDADLPGLNFWFGIINRFPPGTAASQLAMVCAFINSAEYQQRFSPLVPRNDSGCPPAP